MTGEHDLGTAAELRRRLQRVIAEGNPIVIDLSPATFIDSSILGVILDARRSANEGGLGFAVAHSNGAGAVGRLLDVTGLRDELPVHTDTEAAALAASDRGGAGTQ